MRHRGPDATGMRSLGTCILGHTRLRIVDLNPRADQPMANEDQTVWVAFNGEIYNFAELRAELEAKGHRFGSSSDTEVIVHLYEEHGAGLVHRLRGMFAFALWDVTGGRFLAARDRLGIKPLYYRSERGGLAVASEVRALRRPHDRIDGRALAAYLRLGWVPGPATILRDVRELPPGHVLTWDERQTRVERYWSIEDVGTSDPPPSLDELSEALLDAGRRHLVADVPVGLFLSSGVDSAVVGELAARASSNVRAFTVAFDDAADESAGAEALSRRLGLDHTRVPVEGGEVLASLPAFIRAMDQPTVDGLNTWVICRAVRDEGIVVALSGLGGDELFAGYSTFRHVPRLVALSRLLEPLPSGARDVPDALTARVGRLAHSRARRALEASVAGGWEAAYAAVRGLFARREIADLWPMAGSFAAGDAVRRSPRPGAGDGSVVTELELGNYLPFQLLRDTDAFSMDHSLEVRVPLLDDEVTACVLRRLAAGAPGWGKADLLAAAAPALGELASRPKQTFTLPIAQWLQGPLRERAFAAFRLLDEAGLGFEGRALTETWQGYGAGRVGWRSVWALVVLGLWLDEHLDGAASIEASEEGEWALVS